MASLIREQIIGCDDPENAKQVRVTREKNYPMITQQGPAWTWVYSYQVDGGPERCYGKGLYDTHRRVRCTFPNGPDHRDLESAPLTNQPDSRASHSGAGE
ncbi:hypothetical protein AB0C34_17040 [Nocardia sp. NPDC049220]|uniref:hypothetical protein n=1 Tax=Nocardia sp. NPDC049220 TaxID=3155273 RepID=UPI0033F7FC34